LIRRRLVIRRLSILLPPHLRAIHSLVILLLPTLLQIRRLMKSLSLSRTTGASWQPARTRISSSS
jgi:hypothetical protein